MQHGKIHGCHQCDYKAATKQHLEIHKHTKHEGIRYSCGQCVYRATSMQAQKNHKKVKHEGVKLRSMRVQSKTKNNLKVHRQSKNEGSIVVTTKLHSKEI